MEQAKHKHVPQVDKQKEKDTKTQNIDKLMHMNQSEE